MPWVRSLHACARRREPAGDCDVRAAARRPAHALGSSADCRSSRPRTGGTRPRWPAGRCETRFDVVVALGGDGTVNEVANGLLTTASTTKVPALAWCPPDSTNVFARAIGLQQPVEATERLLDGLRHGRGGRSSLGRLEDRCRGSSTRDLDGDPTLDAPYAWSSPPSERRIRKLHVGFYRMMSRTRRHLILREKVPLRFGARQLRCRRTDRGLRPPRRATVRRDGGPGRLCAVSRMATAAVNGKPAVLEAAEADRPPPPVAKPVEQRRSPRSVVGQPIARAEHVGGSGGTTPSAGTLSWTPYR